MDIPLSDLPRVAMTGKNDSVWANTPFLPHGDILELCTHWPYIWILWDDGGPNIIVVRAGTDRVQLLSRFAASRWIFLAGTPPADSVDLSSDLRQPPFRSLMLVCLSRSMKEAVQEVMALRGGKCSASKIVREALARLILIERIKVGTGHKWYEGENRDDG